jgi:hypothetical protein
LTIQRARGPIAIDGDLGDPGWRDIPAVEKWYETNPGDNVEPAVKNVGYLAYDDAFLYAAFRFEDPAPRRIRAPLGDRDNVPSYTDYAGVILDTRDTGKTAILFLANAHGIQYDAVTDDAPARIPRPILLGRRRPRDPRGLEPRAADPVLHAALPEGGRADLAHHAVPQLPARLPDTDVQHHDAPRGNCFICRSNPLTGLRGLPAGGGIVAAPYVSATRTALPEDGLGTPLTDTRSTAPGAWT